MQTNASTTAEQSPPQKERKLPKESIANIRVKCLDPCCGKTDIVARLGPRFPFFNWLLAYYACRHCCCKKLEVLPPERAKDEGGTLENLRTLLGQINNEITRYRDYEWKIVVWSVVFSWGVFLFSFTKIQETFTGP